MFIVDSNFFIQAHRNTYPLDVASSFWIKVKELVDSNIIISIDKVRDEIYSNEDALKVWCEGNLPDGFFINTNTVLAEYATVVNWAQSKSDHFKPEALAEFMAADEADAWLIAAGLNRGLPIITHEKSQPECRRKVKIPDVCIALGSRYMNTIEMFRNLGQTF